MNLFEKTDQQFHSKHPDLNGRKLTDSPNDKPYRQEYLELLKENKKSNSASNEKTCDSTQKCLHKDKENNSKSDTCSASSIGIKKDNNSYELKIPGTTFNYKGNFYKDIDAFEMVAGPKQKAITVHVKSNGIKGPCAGKHKGSTFNFKKGF